jgi:hypothetical protein
MAETKTQKPEKNKPPKPEKEKSAFAKRKAFLYDNYLSAIGSCKNKPCRCLNCYGFATRAASNPKLYLSNCKKFKGIIRAVLQELEKLG